jgi:DNA-binding MarR family transcriptional regulator
MDPIELLYDVGRLYRLISEFAGRDLGRSEAGVLSAVAQRPRRVTELAQFLDLTQPRVTAVARSMEEQGLLRRTSDPADGRVVVLELTEQGAAASRARRRRIAHTLHELLMDQPVDSDALIEAAATALHALVGELESALSRREARA